MDIFTLYTDLLLKLIRTSPQYQEEMLLGGVSNTIYDSEDFKVNHVLMNAKELLSGDGTTQAFVVPRAMGYPQLARHGFEIINKRTQKEIYLDGSWSEVFQKQIIDWQNGKPSEEEVDAILDGYTQISNANQQLN